MTQNNAISVVRSALLEAETAINRLIANEDMLGRIAKAGHLIAERLRAGSRVYACGNGGSLCDAMHFAEEMTGRYRENRRPFAALAISDAAHMSCVSNDFSYLDVFSRYVEAHGRAGDILLAISTSGRSENILRAIDAAHANGLQVICLTGNEDSPVAVQSDLAIVTPGGRYADRVQELHIKCIHILIELVEKELCPENCAD